MRALVQRVSEARVRVGEEIVGQIGAGLVVFLGVKNDDSLAEAEYLAKKVVGLRIFPDAEGRNNINLTEVGGGLLIVSQFTLYAETQRGNRPSYAKAASAPIAEPLYDHFVRSCRGNGVPVQTGVFQAHMQVALVNDGPITVLCSTES
jgi:D-aminoacyl-tRNA deacylase